MSIVSNLSMTEVLTIQWVVDVYNELACTNHPMIGMSGLPNFCHPWSSQICGPTEPKTGWWFQVVLRVQPYKRDDWLNQLVFMGWVNPPKSRSVNPCQDCLFSEYCSEHVGNPMECHKCPQETWHILHFSSLSLDHLHATDLLRSVASSSRKLGSGSAWKSLWQNNMHEMASCIKGDIF